MKRKLSLITDSKIPDNTIIPWVEKYFPEKIEDLAVHKKKVAEVETWLETFFLQNEKNKVSPILLLTGPPGAGKTSTVKTLCKKINAELFTWSNSWQENSKSVLYSEGNINTQNYGNHWINKENQSSAFSGFLLRSTKYSLFYGAKRIILIEEFPNAFLRDSSLFHKIVQKYSVSGKCPAVFIISDSVKGESLESRLFPKDIQLTLKLSNISFNPIAPTMLMKVLNKINSKVDSACKRLNKSQLEEIAADSMGDIRNAINSLQFLCMSQSSKSKSKSLPRSKKDSKLKESDAQDLKRDSSLFLFHALGKILYCKRDASAKSDHDALPDHMKHLEKDPPLAKAEEVYEKTSISADGFCLFLQENYISFTSDINAAANCAFWMSEADILSAYWSGTDVMNDYLVSVATRGLMYNIGCPPTGNRWKPLHKPQFYENNSKKNQAKKTLERTFKESGLSLEQLQIDLVPFLSKLNFHSLPPDQRILVKELGEMKVKKQARISSATLDEKDVFLTDSNDCDLDDSVPENTNSEDVNLQLSDEEIVIEEYDF